MNDIEYRLEKGLYNLYGISEGSEGVIIRSYPDMAIAIDVRAMLVMRHGGTDYVNEWFEKRNIRFRELDIIEMNQSIIVISGELPLDKVNRLLNDPTYIEDFIKWIKEKMNERREIESGSNNELGRPDKIIALGSE